jgi:hypothetical protein
MATYTESTPTLWRFQCDPAADGCCTVQAFYRSELINDEDASDKISKDRGNVSFDLPPELTAQIIALAETARG